MGKKHLFASIATLLLIAATGCAPLVAPTIAPEPPASTASPEPTITPEATAPLTQKDDAYWDDYLAEYKEKVEAIFPYPHYYGDREPIECDLNGDGEIEKIALINLGGNGGDGAFTLEVSSGGKQIPLPEAMGEDGFPYLMVFDGEKLSIVMDGRVEAQPDELMRAIYRANFSNEDWEIFNWEIFKGKPEIENADCLSGAAIMYGKNDEGSSPVLMLKQYIKGPGGHSFCIGYGITELVLKDDGTWKEPKYAYYPMY